MKKKYYFKVVKILKKIASVFKRNKTHSVGDIYANLDDVKRAIAMQYYGPKSPEAIYSNMGIAHRCMELIGSALSSVPISIVDTATGEEIDEDPVESILKMANEFDTLSTLLERATIDYHLRGNAFWYVTDPTLNPNTTEIVPLYPQITKPADRFGNIIAMNYGRGDELLDFAGWRNDQTGEFFPKEQVININSYNPYHRLLGKSVFAAAADSFDFDDRVSGFKIALYENQATPSGVLKMPYNDDMTNEVAAELSDEAKEEWGGIKNARTIKVLKGGMEYQQIAWTPKDMELVQSQNMTWVQIVSIFGVPSEMFGSIGGTKNRSVYEEARRNFYDTKIFPLAEKFYGIISKFFWPRGERKIKINVESVRGFVPKAEELPYGLTVRQVLSRTGNKTAEQPGEINPIYDRILVPSNLEPLDNMVIEPAAAPQEM